MTRDLSLLSNPDSVKGRLQRACLDVLEREQEQREEAALLLSEAGP